MGAFKKYFNKSQKFGALFYTNFGVLSILLLLGFARFLTGLLRDKPVGQIAICLIVLTVIIILFLKRLTNLVCTKTVPALYNDEIIAERKDADDWQWQYFLLGSSVLAASFVPVVNHTHKQDSSSDSSSSGCGSSCGSSCSSCGGCGGD